MRTEAPPLPHAAPEPASPGIGPDSPPRPAPQLPAAAAGSAGRPQLEGSGAPVGATVPRDPVLPTSPMAPGRAAAPFHTPRAAVVQAVMAAPAPPHAAAEPASSPPSAGGAAPGSAPWAPPQGAGPQPPAAPSAAPQGQGGGGPWRRRGATLLRWLGMAMAPLGWRRVQANNALAHSVRADIQEHLRRAPGAHLRGLARALGLTPQNADYHLRQLGACGLVSETRVGGKRCFYPTEGGREAREAAVALGLLAGSPRGAVLAALREAPGAHQAALARRAGVGQGVAGFALRDLLRHGLVAPQEAGGRARRWTITEAGERALARLEARLPQGPRGEVAVRPSPALPAPSAPRVPIPEPRAGAEPLYAGA